jgi:hypothetical protein
MIISSKNDDDFKEWLSELREAMTIVVTDINKIKIIRNENLILPNVKSKHYIFSIIIIFSVKGFV